MYIVCYINEDDAFHASGTHVLDNDCPLLFRLQAVSSLLSSLGPKLDSHICCPVLAVKHVRLSNYKVGSIESIRNTNRNIYALFF